MYLKPLICALACAFPIVVHATASLNGVAGILNMPDARVEQDGNFAMGYSYDKPYSSLWMNLTPLPFVQTTARFVTVHGVRGFEGTSSADSYGNNKDKVIDVKLRLLEESKWWPQIAVGRTDIFGTQLFKGSYVAMSKQLGPVDFTLGHGSGRIDGPFAGMRWQMPFDGGAWTLNAEYDANDYTRDYRAQDTFARNRKPGPVVGLDYRWGWLGAKIARSKSATSVSGYIDIPLNAKEYIPKVYEPAAYSSTRVRPTREQWNEDSSYRLGLLDALHKQDFRSVKLSLKQGTLNLELTNTRISNIGRAVGRAVRTALYFIPADTRQIKLRYTRNNLALTEYEFFDLPRLSEYLSGKLERKELQDIVLVRHAGSEADDDAELSTLSAALDEGSEIGIVTNEGGNSVQLRGEDKQLNTFQIVPKMGLYFNDPSGVLKYEINAYASVQRHLAPGHIIDGAMTYKLLENISSVTQKSNSLLPHVRSDIAEYKRGNDLKLNQLAYTYLFQPGTRFYGKVSTGLFEEMYGGVAGQLAYYPPSSRWIAELRSEVVQQRGFSGWFDRRDYNAVTALASLHYKLPYGVTVTGRAGRFLAKDSGVRMEIKRRFDSGIEAGAWYTYTDAKDTTSPGSVGSPYQDKGLFLSIPLNSMLPTDSRAKSNMSISPWTRDGGQMVFVPHDLVSQIEDPARQMALDDGLGNIGEQPNETFSNDLPDPAWWPSASGIHMRMSSTVDALPEISDAAIAGTLGVAAIAVASSRDKVIYNAIQKRKDNQLLKAWGKFGSGAPLIAVGAAGAAMTLSDDPIMVNTSIISLQSAALAAGVSLGTKQLVDRARPGERSGSVWQKSTSGSSSFPSNHAAVTMAALTPFAEEYQLPWLYVAGGLASAGRVANGKHWVSDAVAGGLLGYGVGHWLWKGQRNTLLAPMISPTDKTIGLSLSHQY